MSSHGETGQGVPGDHVGDAGLDASDEVGGDIKASRIPEKDTSVRGAARPHRLFIFPLVLGVFICALNILIAARFWQFVWPSAVAVTLITTSTFIGLFLIVYGAVLRRFAGSRQKSEIAPGSVTNHEPSKAPWYFKWAVALPLLVALPAPAVTVWGAETAKPVAPRPQSVTQAPCIELYQDALNIKKDNPNFTMPSTAPEQVRCRINTILAQ